MKSNVGPVLLAAFGPYDDPDEPRAPGSQPMNWRDGDTLSTDPICFAQFVDQRDGGVIKTTIARNLDQRTLEVGKVYNVRLNMTFEPQGRKIFTKFRLLAVEAVGAPAAKAAAARTPVPA